jgi:hypothetical protein
VPAPDPATHDSGRKPLLDLRQLVAERVGEGRWSMISRLPAELCPLVVVSGVGVFPGVRAPV